MIEIKKYNLRLVREEGPGYQLENERITGPAPAAKIFREFLELDHRTQEVFAIATLDTASHVTGIMEVSTGSLSASIVHPRDVFQRAILQNAAAIILCHNHPSGNLEPSEKDISLTRKLVEAGKIMGIEVFDHLIISDNNYLSMRGEGMI